MQTQSTSTWRFVGVAAVALGLSACGGGSTSSEFPTGLAIDSPVSMDPSTTTLAQASPAVRLKAIALALMGGNWQTAAQLAGRLLPIADAHAAHTRSPRYLKSANAINALLTGATTPHAGVAFNANQFLKTPVNAGCYGPTVRYQDHPDASPPVSGELPSGDVGIWNVINTTAGSTWDWACAPAQLDARMEGVAMRSNTSLMTLASLINVANSAGKPMPIAGASLVLTGEMNTAFSASGITFSSATVAQPTAGSYTYAVAFSFTHTTHTHTSETRYAEIRLSHSGSSRNNYDGLLTYAVTKGTANSLNCGGSDTVDVGSLKYSRTARDAMTLVHREGNYCGAASATPLSNASFGSDGQLDPAAKYTTNPNGWANNFSRFGAVYDPTTLKGNYAFGWQAGPADDNARVFNIGLNYDTPTERRDGEAYFGYGADIATSSGTINGFICNWAGPGNNHALQHYAQRQHITFDDSSGKWRPSLEAADSSNITFAPTNSCEITLAGGAFYYDKNANNSLTDELAVSNPKVEIGLRGPGTYSNMWEYIASRGVIVPAY